MAAPKERGLFVMIFREFIKSLTPKFQKHTLVGEDMYGTKYYQIAKGDSIHNKPNRYFVPKDKDEFEQEIPAEWEAWLRNRRKLPPTEEEVNANYEMILTKRDNAAKIEAQYAKETDVLQLADPNAKPASQHASLNFPVYDEYIKHGRDYRPKTK